MVTQLVAKGDSMKVRKRKIIGPGHSIEFGKATWDPQERSIRNRYATRNGGFSPRSSSELPVGDVEELAVGTAEEDEIDVRGAVRVIRAMLGTIARQTHP
jgi:hypothetical protein